MELKTKNNIGIKDAMTYNVITATSDTKISDIATMMTKNDISSVVIEDERVEGIVTSNNIISKVVSKNISPQDITADMVMDKFVEISPSTSLVEASSLMIKNNCKVVLVIDDNNDLKGLLTLTDIVRVSPELIELFIEETSLEDYSEDKQYKASDESLDEGVCEKCGVYGELEDNDGQYLCSECIEELSEE
ncbi:CBS domain-containing protein [Methanosphaera sp.]